MAESEWGQRERNSRNGIILVNLKTKLEKTLWFRQPCMLTLLGTFLSHYSA